MSLPISLQQLLYNLGVNAYHLAVHLAQPFVPKAKAWVQGRNQWHEKMQNSALQGCIWFHAASSGEFEQAKPIIEWLKKHYPEQKIVATFFSPSGYELCKNYKHLDAAFYLPMDTPQNAKKFIQILQPQLAIFIKYEFWLNMLTELHEQQVPVILVSAIFRPKSLMFQGPLKKLYQQKLATYAHVFLQDEASYKLLVNYLPQERLTVSGDTRFDRVLQIYNTWQPLQEVEAFLPSKPILMVGSSWEADEQLVQQLLTYLPEWQCVIIPHELTPAHLTSIKNRFSDTVFYTSWVKEGKPVITSRVRVIDTMGWLSRLYAYADACWIGGGFGKSIHNTLEAAVYGKPLLFGPKHHKFKEAKDLLQIGAAFCIHDKSILSAAAQWLNNEQLRLQNGYKAQNYVLENKGATATITEWLHHFLNP